MKIYTSSKELKGVSSDVKYLSFSILSEVSDDDIVLTTGTFGGELTIKSLFKKGVVPVVILIKKEEQEVNSFVESIALTLTEQEYSLDADFLQRCRQIAQKSREFCSAVDEYEETIETEDMARKILAFVYVSEIINSRYPQYGKNQLRGSQTKTENREFYYIMHETGGKGKYFFLIKGDRLKLFSINSQEKSLDDLNKMLCFMDDEGFQTLYNGEYNLFKELQPFNFEDITHGYKENYILFYSDQEYQPGNTIFKKANIKLFEATLNQDNELLFAHEDVKQLFCYRLLHFDRSEQSLEQIKKAVDSVRTLIVSYKDANSFDTDSYKNLYTFLKFQKNAKKLISKLDSKERQLLFGEWVFVRTDDKKDTNTNESTSKIDTTSAYDNVTFLFSSFMEKIISRHNKEDDDRKIANIDFAFSLLSSRNISDLTDDELNTIFQDIKNGIDINKASKDLFNENISATQFEGFVTTVKEAHEILEASAEEYTKKELETYGKVYSANIYDGKYIDFLITGLRVLESEKYKDLIKKLKNILYFLAFEQTGSMDSDAEIDHNDALQENEWLDFIRKFLSNLLNYRGCSKLINVKKLSTVIGVFLANSTEVKDMNCFFYFLRQYDADVLLLAFDEFIDTSWKEPIDQFILSTVSYRCEVENGEMCIDIVSYKRNCMQVESLERALRSYKTNQMKKFQNFIQYILQEEISCEDDETVEFLSIFAGQKATLTGSDKCKSLVNAFFGETT